jgi:ATP-dependent exoDNAse (exonuclease V) alpha subunit
LKVAGKRRKSKNEGKICKGKLVSIMEEFIHDEYTRKAMELVRLGRSFFITGKAGTGKTTLLRKIVSECRARGKNVAVSAPTGVAAKNAEGQTLHSLLGLKTIVFIPGKIRKWYRRMDDARVKVIKNLDILIIDEISMVRCDVLDMVDLTLQHYKGNKKPFGGIQVVLFGDLFQLPPVVTENEEELLYSYYKNNPYFFSSDVISKYPFPVLELVKVYRQKEDKTFVNILNHIREGIYLESDREELNKRLKKGYKPSKRESGVYLRTIKSKVWGHNIGKLEELPGKEESFKAYIEGDFPTKLFPTDYELLLKVDAKVMLLRNDNDGLKYVNGTQGVISSIYDGTIRVKTDEGELISVERSTWELYKYVYEEETNSIVPIVVASFKQFPIKLAWAVTIHKSQGMTFNKVIVDASKSFASGQVYVALSRCRSLDGLILTSKISESDIMVDPVVVDYMKSVERIISNEIEQESDKLEKHTFFFNDKGKTITGISSEMYGNIIIPDGVEKIADEALKIIRISQVSYALILFAKLVSMRS